MMLFRFTTVCVLLFSAAHATPWDEKAKEVDQWTDKLGMPVDAGIKETLIALNLANIKTFASCEGHLDHGYPFPWIDLDLSTPQIVAATKELYQFISEKVKLKVKFEEASPELKVLRDQQLKVIGEAKQPLQQLLNEFYKTHFSSYERMLVLTHVTEPQSLYRLHSQGVQFYLLSSPEEKVMKLKEYQEEMALFGQFLKNRLADKQ